MSALAIGYPEHATTSTEVSIRSFGVEAITEAGDPLILLLDSCGNVDEDTLGSLKIELNNALEQGRRLVLTIGPVIAATYNSGFVTWLMNKLGFSVTLRQPGLEVGTQVPQLRGYFSEQLCHATVIDAQGLEQAPRNGQVLATAVNANGELAGTAASRWIHNESEVIALPHRRPQEPGALDAVLQLLQDLPSQSERPSYLDDFVLGNEAVLREELAATERRAEEIEDELDAIRRSKAILHLTGIELERETARLLTELGLPARHYPGNREDLQLVDGASEEVWGIGEVKATESRSIDRTEVGKLDTHRKEAGHPPDFPALLLASTFRARQVIDERDEPIAPNVVRRAAEDHILIVRALDLIRLKQMAISGTKPEVELRDAVVAGGGWFEVRPDCSVTVHTA